MEIQPEKSETIAFLGQDPATCKIIMDNRCLQVNNFKYLSCENSYENEKDIQQKLAEVFPILRILNTFKTNLVQKFSRINYFWLSQFFCMGAKFATL
jgi:hypothetical protein